MSIKDLNCKTISTTHCLANGDLIHTLQPPSSSIEVEEVNSCIDCFIVALGDLSSLDFYYSQEESEEIENSKSIALNAYSKGRVIGVKTDEGAHHNKFTCPICKVTTAHTQSRVVVFTEYRDLQEEEEFNFLIEKDLNQEFINETSCLFVPYYRRDFKAALIEGITKSSLYRYAAEASLVAAPESTFILVSWDTHKSQYPDSLHEAPLNEWSLSIHLLIEDRNVSFSGALLESLADNLPQLQMSTFVKVLSGDWRAAGDELLELLINDYL